jgi:hypothetical protein
MPVINETQILETEITMTDLRPHAWRLYDDLCKRTAGGRLRAKLRAFIQNASAENLEIVRDAIENQDPPDELSQRRRVARELARWPNGMPADL